MTILIRCADPRINKFLEEVGVGGELGITKDEYSLISNTGSIRYFLEKDRMNDLFGQLDILINHFSADRIVLLNHTDCGFYKSLGLDKEENYLSDLKKVKSDILNKYPDIRVEGYLINTESGALKNEDGEKLLLPYSES